MQSHIERIETRAFRNLHMSSNTVSTGGIDDPDFKIDEVEQLTDALNLLVKHCKVRGRGILVSDNREPFYFKIDEETQQRHLYYRDPIILRFVNAWIKLDKVEQTFLLIDFQHSYDRERFNLDSLQHEEIDIALQKTLWGN